MLAQSSYISFSRKFIVLPRKDVIALKEFITQHEKHEIYLYSIPAALQMIQASKLWLDFKIKDPGLLQDQSKTFSDYNNYSLDESLCFFDYTKAIKKLSFLYFSSNININQDAICSNNVKVLFLLAMLTKMRIQHKFYRFVRL